MTAQPIPTEFDQALRELGLAGSRPLTGWPLTGGVSSDIWCIQTDQGQVCAKRALAKLRVAADWRAPIERNLYEARWMQQAQIAAPGLLDPDGDAELRAELSTIIREAVAKAGGKSGDEILREAVRRAVRSNARAWSGRKPVTEIHLVRV